MKHNRVKGNICSQHPSSQLRLTISQDPIDTPSFESSLPAIDDVAGILALAFLRNKATDNREDS